MQGENKLLIECTVRHWRTFSHVLMKFDVCSIDEDLLTFLDGVELDKVLKEAALAIRKDDFTAFLRKKSEITIDHFLVSCCINGEIISFVL